jgi:trans-aconitate methyltransferase
MPENIDSTRPGPEVIEQFLHNVRGTIPIAIEQIEIMLKLVAAGCSRLDRVLDLGCAGGLVASAVLEEYPRAEAALLESSQSRLQSIRAQLGFHADRASYHLGRIDRPDWRRQIAAHGPFDLVIAGIEVPLLPEERRREIFAEIYELMNPGGLLLNVEYVASATRWTESRWDDQMIDTIFGELIRKGEKKPRLEIAREFYELTARGQQVAPLEVQCDWLREIGYESVECYLKVSELAVFGGQKPGGNDE